MHALGGNTIIIAIVDPTPQTSLAVDDVKKVREKAELKQVALQV